ncbi:MAG TPA: glycogen debranching protein GlgX [Nocardioidaceae bacterium]|nr:glycogen debranching protein GlgX [Nocardioidaceae bacterium]
MTTPDGPPSLWPGHHQHLGARYDGKGTNFAVWAPAATSMTLCLFDDDGGERRLDLLERTLGVWHGYVPDARPGLRYGFRVDGPWDPAHHRVFNPEKLLLDPYALAIDGELTAHPSLSAETTSAARNPGDTAAYTPRSVVVAPDTFEWGDDRRPAVPWGRTVIYEAHVRGLTKLHPDVPEHLRGTYAGLGHPAITGYLNDLGVTSIELLPVQQFVSEPWLSDAGRVNYWGYNTVGFFAPHAGYAATGTRGEQVDEFKQMVKDLHAAGIEVILDVVYNHTAESGRGGPAICFRGYEDASYYRHDASGRYVDVTGCGNTVNVSEPQVLQLVMDSLRYWVSEMHVDGFRFDLASALARGSRGLVNLRAPFLTAIHQDPVLREVKLIAEPWDATGEGYLVGRFPPPWCEWNDKYRDGVRDFWRGAAGGVRELASRFSGSSDLYDDDGRQPFASINFVTAHDGFTLRDLVSYEAKHNEANGENNRDGSNSNRSWNCGVEGETADPQVRSLRRRQAANLLTTLLLSTGVPMLTAGDERGRTQRGNNNAFCHDNELSWVSWRHDPDWAHLHELTRTVLGLRAAHPVLRQRYFFEGKPLDDSGGKDITWLSPTGEEMTQDDWHDSSRNTLGIFLAGNQLRAVDREGVRRRDTSYLLWLHAGADTVDVTLPEPWAKTYDEVVRTDKRVADGSWKPGATVTLQPRTVALFEAVAG